MAIESLKGEKRSWPLVPLTVFAALVITMLLHFAYDSHPRNTTYQHVPQFTDNADGTVTDNRLQVVWLKQADCFGRRMWQGALEDLAQLNSGECGLTDGSSSGGWRIASEAEIVSLFDTGNYSHMLPHGHPFTGVREGCYWLSSDPDNKSDEAQDIYLGFGSLGLAGQVQCSLQRNRGNFDGFYFWPVRDIAP